jgi:hypothetical protein
VHVSCRSTGLTFSSAGSFDQPDTVGGLGEAKESSLAKHSANNAPNRNICVSLGTILVAIVVSNSGLVVGVRDQVGCSQLDAADRSQQQVIHI